MKIIETNLKDLVVIQPQAFEDERGNFMESFKNSFFDIEEKFISFSFKLKIFKAFKADSGIIGNNKKDTFLMISKEV